MAKTPYDKAIASIKRSRTKRLARLITKSYLLYRRKQDEQMYNLICEEFMSLGGVYVKFLQGVLLRSTIMKKWHNPEKLNIFENLDHEPLDIGQLLQTELGKDRLSNIALIQPEPFAAGSFGQVYYARLRSGETVIVKVLRPMVRELLKHDLKLLSRFYKTFFIKMNKNMAVDIDTAFKEFAQATLRETDYKQEAGFATEMYQRYKNHPTIFVPKTYLELCTDNIIVQDYVDGVSMAHIVKMHEDGVDPVQYAHDTTGSDLTFLLQEYGYESLIGIFEMSKIQGDPHPGNLRVMKNNRIGLIDFGISAKPPTDMHGMYGLLESYNGMLEGSQSAIDMFEHGLRFFVNDLYRSLRTIGDYLDRGGDRDYVNEVSKVAGKVFYEATGTDIVSLGKSNDDASVIIAINKLVNKGNRFGLVVKLEASDMLRAIQTYTSMLSSLGLYQKVMPETLDKAIKHIREEFPEVAIDNSESMDISTAIENISNWLERVADRDPMLFSQLAETIRSQSKSKDVQLELEGENNA